jgi:hypothetical protein
MDTIVRQSISKVFHDLLHCSCESKLIIRITLSVSGESQSTHHTIRKDNPRMKVTRLGKTVTLLYNTVVVKAHLLRSNSTIGSKPTGSRSEPGCIDSPAVWLYLCDWFKEKPERCDGYGDVFRNDDFSASQACCICGGGLQYGLQLSCDVNDPEHFNICLDLGSSSGQYESWMGHLALAKLRWERIIHGDTGHRVSTLDLVTSTELENGSFVNFTSTRYPDYIDDIYISIRDAQIDGEGGVIGHAGVIYTRNRGNHILALSGFIEFDEADIERMSSRGILNDVIKHETAHVLGFGSLWEVNDLYPDDGSGMYAMHTKAVREWRALGCSGPLPVELDGGEGTASGHWDEDCFPHELMSGYVRDNTNMALSRISIASFEDLGYSVDYSQADPYSIADLGVCGSFCPESDFESAGRHLGSVKESPYRRLQEAARAKILSYAKPLLEGFHKHKPSELPENVNYVGDKSIEVVYLDDDGAILFVEVSSRELDGA